MEIIKTENTRAGRPAMEGSTRRYIVADDVHEWIIQHGGGQYITDTMRCVRVTSGGKGAVTDYAMCILRAATCFDFEVDLTEPYADLGLKARDMILSEVKEPETYHVYKDGTWKDGVFCNNIGSLAISSLSECPDSILPAQDQIICADIEKSCQVNQQVNGAPPHPGFQPSHVVF